MLGDGGRCENELGGGTRCIGFGWDISCTKNECKIIKGVVDTKMGAMDRILPTISYIS